MLKLTKVKLSLSKKVVFIYFRESPLKMFFFNKNVFYVMLKAFFVLKIFHFLSWPFWSYRKTAWKESEGWYGMVCLGDVHFILPKECLTRLRPNHRVLGCLIDLCYQDITPNIQVDPEVKRKKKHGDIFLDLEGSIIGCQMGYTIFIYLLSRIRSSQF